MPPDVEVEKQVEQDVTAPETPDTEVAETEVEQEQEVSAADGEKVEDSPYQPNKKYKFTDEKGEAEAEFDEWVTPLLKKETEDKFRDLYSRAKGLEFMKSSREKTRVEKADVERQYNEFQTAVKEVLDLKEKNLGVFLEKMGVSRQQMAKMVLEDLEAEEKLKDLPPHLQKMYTQNQELTRKVMELEKQANQGTNFGLEQATQALNLQLQAVLSKPEISSIASEYDARRGRPGAFFEQVKREGLLENSMSGKDLTADEAVQRALETLALQVQTSSQSVTPNGTGAAPKTVVVQQKAVPTIPTVGNGTATATSKRPKSVDDLRRMAKEMQAEAS